MRLFIVKHKNGELYLAGVKPDLLGGDRAKAYRFGNQANAETAKRRIEKIPGTFEVVTIEWDQQQGQERHAANGV